MMAMRRAANKTTASAWLLINRLLMFFRPDKADITYLWTIEDWLHLAVIIDVFSRMVVGWALAACMTADLICQALQMALWRRKMPKGVILHSERGSQYCSAAYQRLVLKHQQICSMSAKGT
jgi:transposase InsO family protein